MHGRSSWISEYVWMHSTAQASGSAASIAPAASFRRRQRQDGPQPFAAGKEAVAHRLVDASPV